MEVGVASRIKSACYIESIYFSIRRRDRYYLTYNLCVQFLQQIVT